MKPFAAIQVEHLDLSQGVPPLPALPGGRGYLVVLWWEGIPLGLIDVPASRLPMPAPQLEELALKTAAPAVGDALFESGFKAPLPYVPMDAEDLRPPPFGDLAALERPFARLSGRARGEETGPRPADFSVVVCTRERPAELDRCLRSLLSLDPAPGEVLVVDNAPATKRTREAVERFSAVRYTREPKAGLSAARNRGVIESRGAVMAFTDDDVVVHPGWIAGLAAGFFGPQVMAVTGLVLPAELETEAQVLFQYSFGGFDRGFRRLVYTPRYFKQRKDKGVPAWKIGAGANMAVRREAFEIAGLFDERLGAGAAGCSEDSELWYRLLAAGRSCCYEPRAVVFHRHRCDLQGLRRQMHLYMRGHVAALLAQFERYGHFGNLYRAFLTLPKYYLGLLLKRLLGGRGGGDVMLGTQMLGCAAGFLYYLRERAAGRRAERRTLPARQAARTEAAKT